MRLLFKYEDRCFKLSVILGICLCIGICAYPARSESSTSAIPGFNHLLKGDYEKAIYEADITVAENATGEEITRALFVKSAAYFVQGKEAEYLTHMNNILGEYGDDTRTVDGAVIVPFGLYGMTRETRIKRPDIYTGHSVPLVFLESWFNTANDLRKTGMVLPLNLLVKQAEASFSVELFRIRENYEKALEANGRHIQAWRGIARTQASGTTIEAVIGSLIIQRGDLLYLLDDLNGAKQAYTQGKTIFERLGKLDGSACITPRVVLATKVAMCEQPQKFADYSEVIKNLEVADYYRAIAGFYKSSYCYEKALKYFNLTLQAIENVDEAKRKRYATQLKHTFEQLRSEILPAQIRHCQDALITR